MFGLFKKKKTTRTLLEALDDDDMDGPSVSSSPSIDRIKNNIGIPLVYNIERVSNGYHVNSYVENNQGYNNNKSFQKVFTNHNQVIKFLTKQLNEVEDQIKIEILKQ